MKHVVKIKVTCFCESKETKDFILTILIKKVMS